ncbi:MAG: hypothetical protein J6S38_00660, partial [Erysipelotrichaceae bacterium]|nr:hypothetical protein [Erysipelotrichaceae bacterium]
HKERLNEFREQYIEEGFVSDVPYQWTISSDDFDDTISEHFTFYTKDGMIQEHHTQNVFDLNKVTEKMNKYFKVKTIEDFVEDEKILMVGYLK